MVQVTCPKCTCDIGTAPDGEEGYDQTMDMLEKHLKASCLGEPTIPEEE